MKVAVIGAGISGLSSAAALVRHHEVTVFERYARPGGHADTVDVVTDHGTLAIDTGFIVFNDLHYPELCRLFDELGVSAVESDMSFSVRCERTGLEYNGDGLASLFAQPRNLLSPGHWAMIRDIARFHRDAPGYLEQEHDDRITVEEFARRHRLGAGFVERYLVPLGASLWSCSAGEFRRFPMRFVLEFLRNHHMLQAYGRPRWKTVRGGSRAYVTRLAAPLASRMRLSTGVAGVRRGRRGVEVTLSDGTRERFDEVVVAVHADQALALVRDADEHERAVLEHFPYEANEAVLHTDARVLPRLSRCRASWNYCIPASPLEHVTVTYDMTRLQRLATDETYCVTLNPTVPLAPERVLRRTTYHHPRFRPGRAAAQAEHPSMIRRRGISYCGAYWGYGFHEDGLVSALRVCASFDASPYGLAA